MPEGVHPTALVDPKATLGPGVRVGAFSVVGSEVTIGADAEIGHHCVFEGRVEIGERAKVGHGSLLGGLPQDLKYRGDIPSGVRIGADIINGAAISGHCEIGERATIGAFVGIVPFTRIGAYAYVGGLSRVNADVPPYVLVEGNPATAHGINIVGLRRAGIAAADRRLLQDAYRLLYRSGLSPRRAGERIRQELPVAAPVLGLLDFIAGARRGICGAAQRGGSALGGGERLVSRSESEPV